MLSILIPIYNRIVIDLVFELKSEADLLNINYEIILMDDFSENKFKEKNQQLKKIEKVEYIELEGNVGRSKIRNILADMAIFDNLIFLDCDSEINTKKFIKNYLDNQQEGCLVFGGTIISRKSFCKSCSLRWLYEHKVYTHFNKKLEKRPFTSNNFFVSKKLFNSIRFNEEWKSYGYEDSFFAIELKMKGYKIINIYNPVIHCGLENNNVYLNKIESAIFNLQKIYIASTDKVAIAKEIKLIRHMERIQKLRVIVFVANFFIYNRNRLKTNLLSEKPKVRFFKIYKLGYLCYLQNKYLIEEIKKTIMLK